MMFPRLLARETLKSVAQRVNCMQAAVRPFASSASSERLTLCEEANGIRTITLNNPKKRNAMSYAMMNNVIEDLSRDVESSQLHVIILRANGPVFSSGHDLRELTMERGCDFHKTVFDKCTEMMTLVKDVPVPVVAQIKGLATAAGCQLAASCDIVVAGESARFGTPGVHVGLFCSTPAVPIGRALPRKVAAEMLFTGRTITAQQACTHGLVSRVVPDDQVEDATLDVARAICETSPSVSAVGKKCFYQQLEMNHDDAYQLAQRTMLENVKSRDCQEGIKAFIEKRKPVWSNSDEKA